MYNAFEKIFKMVTIIILVCLYYVGSILIVAYFISMFENGTLGNLANDWTSANEKLTNSVISNETTHKFTAAISINPIRYVRLILDTEVYRNGYIFISTSLLSIISLSLILNKKDNKFIESDKKSQEYANRLKWMSQQDILILKQKHILAEKNGIILGQYQKGGQGRILTIPSTGKTNKNILLIGNSGSGKSRAFVKANIINLSKDNHSFVISDPKGEYLNDTANFLSQKGYDVKVLNLVNIKQSHRWNPIDYINDSIDAKYMADIVVEKIHRDNKSNMDEKIKKIQAELIKNLIVCIKEKFNKNVQNFNALYNILATFKVNDIDELLMHESDLQNLSEYSFYLKQASKDKEIAINDLIHKLSILDMKTVASMLKSTEIKIEMLKVRPCAYYIILPDLHQELDLIGALFLSMVNKKVTELHDDTKDEVIKNREVYVMLDEFSNFGYIPKFTNKLAQMRARKINCSIIENGVGNIKSLYAEEEYLELVNSCDIKLFYGCVDTTTAKYFTDVIDRSMDSEDSNKITKEELLNMDVDKCIAIIKGQRPAILYKYDWTNLREYKLLSGSSSMGITKWIKHQIEIKADTVKVEDIDSKIKVYGYEDRFNQEINNVLYYNDYINNQKNKAFEKNILQDSDDTEEKAE